MLKKLFNFLFKDSRGQVDEAFLRVVRGYRNARKAQGAKLYGESAYLTRCMFTEATDELIDFMNYMEFQIEKEGIGPEAIGRKKQLLALIDDSIKLLRRLLILMPDQTNPTIHNDRSNSRANSYY